MPRVAAIVALALCVLQDSAELRERRLLARAAADAAKLGVQVKLGGEEKPPEPALSGGTFSDVRTVDGVEDRRYELVVFTPKGVEKNRKPGLIVAYPGLSGRAPTAARVFSKLSTARDPFVVAGITCSKEQEVFGGVETLWKATRWVVQQVQKEQAVDADRIFLAGHSAGGYLGPCAAAGWWQGDRSTFCVRAVIMHAQPGYFSKPLPPVPHICIIGGNDTSGRDRVTPARQWACFATRQGVPVQYHEVPGLGHNPDARCFQIMRQSLNELGGPGAESPDTLQPRGVGVDLGLRDEDAVELSRLCSADRWPRALELAGDRAPLVAALGKAARAEFARVSATLQKGVAGKTAIDPFARMRFTAIREAFPGIGGADLANRIAGHAPSVRDAELEARWRRALELEQGSDPAGAKEILEELARDGSAGIWNRAAAHRLTYWSER
jgi:hypothetical protein